MSPVSAHRAAWLVVLAGGVAALQVGKLPPALAALQAELGLTLVQSGFLLSMVQLAGMSLAVFMGLWADGMGLKRSMVRGLCLLALASGLGAFATSTAALLALRAIEGLGFLLVALPAPALIRRLVPPAQLSGMLGVWGAYMPTGTALALLAGPLFIPAWGWSAWWGLFAGVSLAMAAWLWRSVPADPVAHTAAAGQGARQRLRRTLSARGGACVGWLNVDKPMTIIGEGADGKTFTRRHWIIARSGHGPFIPCIPVILIARHMAAGRRYEPGARPCLGIISLAEYRAEFAHFDIEATDA